MDQEKKRKGHSKVNDQIKRNLYAWITRHTQVVQSPISNDCLKVMFDDQTEPQLVPKLLLQVSVRELHNILVSDPNYGGNPLLEKTRRSSDLVFSRVSSNTMFCCFLFDIKYVGE